MTDELTKNGTRRDDDELDIDDTMLVGRVTELIERGLERYGQGDLDGALSEWEHALALDPECARAEEYAAYVRRQYENGEGSDPAAELSVPFGLEVIGPKTEFDLEPYEEIEVEGTLDMGLPSGLDGAAAPADVELEGEHFAAGPDEATRPFGRMPGSDAAPTNGRRPGTEPEVEFDEEATGAYARAALPADASAVDDGWEFETAPTRLFERDQSLASDVASGETRDRRGTEPPRSVAGEVEVNAVAPVERARATASVEAEDAEPPVSPELPADLASAIDEVTAGLMSIHDRVSDALVDEMPNEEPTIRSRPLELVIPREAVDDMESTQATEAEETAQRMLSDLGSMDLGEFDRDIGEVEQPPWASDAGGDLDLELGYLGGGAGDESVIRPKVDEDPAGRAVQISFRKPAPSESDDEEGSASGSKSPPLVDLGLGPAGQSRAPTEDPTIHTGSIELDDSLLQFDQPTAEHRGLIEAVARLRADGEDQRSAETANAEQSTGELARFESLSEATSYDDIAGDLLNAVDSGRGEETRDDRTRRRVAALIERAIDENRDGNFVRAVVAVDLALQEDPESAIAQKVISRQRDALLEIYRNYVGDLTQIPALAVPMHELKLHEINHRAAFLLSRIDGVLSFEDILDICGMSRLEAFRHLGRLLLQGILEVR